MRKKISLITTGGTIASQETAEGHLVSGVISGSQLAEMCNINNDFEVKIVDVFQLPSMHIDINKMRTIRDAILKELEDDSVDGIVVTHGTDSLEETAYFLDLTIDSSIPIVVTGSQRSPREVGTDVYSNLRNSMYASVSEELRNSGAVVVFNERVYAAKYVKKVHTSNLQGFDSFGQGYLGIIDNSTVNVYQRPVNRELFDIKGSFPRVDIIKCYAGSDGLLIDMLAMAETRGIILEASGRGQVSPQMVSSIQMAIDRGIPIVLTTSAEEGRVYPTYSYSGSAHDLLERGVILGGDYDSKKARIKLLVLLSSGMADFKDSFLI